MDLGMRGKSCIVTGASRGIGLDIVAAMAEEGVNAAMIARDGKAMEEAAQEFRKKGVNVFPIAADLTTEEGVKTSMQAAMRQLGRVDILVNNVSGSKIASFDQVTDADWIKGIALKPLSYVRACRELIPHMRANKYGRIVNVAGGAGRWATADYVMGGLNAATLHFTKALAEELGPDGITVVAVNPGPTGPTDRTQGAFKAWGAKLGVDPAEVEAKYIAGLPLRRMATPMEVARLIVFMASDLAEYTTGGALQVDGGVTRGVF